MQAHHTHTHPVCCPPALTHPGPEPSPWYRCLHGPRGLWCGLAAAGGCDVGDHGGGGDVRRPGPFQRTGSHGES